MIYIIQILLKNNGKYDDDFEYMTIRSKWLYNGYNNIDEMIKSLENQINELKKIKEEGWELESTSFDNYSILINNKYT